MTAPVDQAIRDRIVTETDRTLFVEAGAGSGKTTLLVDRIVALVEDANAPMRNIAAVTFTEKAAAELRDRLRDGLGAKELDDALDELDGAAIGTLHSFARRILVEHPIEAGLPPLVEVLDDIASRVVADRRWNELQTELLEDPATAPLLRLAFGAGIKLDHLRTLAHDLDDNWDLVDQRLRDLPPPATPTIDATPLLHTARELVARLSECRDLTDGLADQLRKLEAWLVACDGADDAHLLEHLGGAPGPGTAGKGANWNGGTVTTKEIKAGLKQLRADALELRSEAVDAVLRGLLARIAADTLEAAHDRVAEGVLRYHDLLVLARLLVREHPDVREVLSQRYRWLLLDESQDTDRLQIEIAVRIAGGRAADAERWEDVKVPPGALFVVGDPKQSIYRFRRADISTYLQAQAHLGETLPLTTNFRSTRAILNWVNSVFGTLIQAEERAQPAYTPLASKPNADDGAPVLVLGYEAAPKKTGADAVRATEARDIAALIATAVREGWLIRDRDSGELRPMTPADVTVLVPTRTSIGGLEDELSRLGVPYRTEAATFVYSAPEVRELLLCARAVDDPTDELAIVATLRGPLFGCTGVDLWRWRAGGGRWAWWPHRNDEPEPTGPVAEGLRQLEEWSRQRSRTSPGELLADIIEARRVLETVADTPRYRETWRRLRFVVDQARAWEESERGSLREYLAWAARQADDTARVVETLLPETDADAARITTIHASKGLEFPVVILAGLSGRPITQRPPVLWPADGGCEIRLGKDQPTLGYADADIIEKRHEECERLRLLYVAATRAVNRLIVSLHREDGIDCPAKKLAEVCPTPTRWSPPPQVTPLPSTDRGPAAAPTWADWEESHLTAVSSASRRAAESATTIAHHQATTELPSIVHAGLDKQPRDLDLPAWRKGRYGAEFGRAVHAVLQTVPLDTGDGLEALAAAQAQAEDIPDAADEIAAAVRSGLYSPLLRRVATRPNWRETYVGTVIDGTVVEGYVDLLYRDEDGLVIVDYKTDVAIEPEALAAYATQVGIYARAVEDAVGEPVVRGVLLFLGQDRALEHVVLEGAAT